MKKLLSLVLTLALALSLCVPAMAASESMANFQKTATYNNQFSTGRPLPSSSAMSTAS